MLDVVIVSKLCNSCFQEVYKIRSLTLTVAEIQEPETKRIYFIMTHEFSLIPTDDLNTACAIYGMKSKLNQRRRLYIHFGKV